MCGGQLDSISVLLVQAEWKEPEEAMERGEGCGNKTGYGCKFWWGFILTASIALLRFLNHADVWLPFRTWLSLANWLFRYAVAWLAADGLMWAYKWLESMETGRKDSVAWAFTRRIYRNVWKQISQRATYRVTLWGDHLWLCEGASRASL